MTNEPVQTKEELKILDQLHRNSTRIEGMLTKIEDAIKTGLLMGSPEVRAMVKRLHELELKSNFWRKRMLKYL